MTPLHIFARLTDAELARLRDIAERIARRCPGTKPQKIENVAVTILRRKLQHSLHAELICTSCGILFRRQGPHTICKKCREHI